MGRMSVFVDEFVMIVDDDVDGDDVPMRRLVMVGAERAAAFCVFKSDVSKGEGVVEVPAC